MKLNLTLSLNASQPVLFDVVYGPFMTIESVKIKAPLVVIIFAYILSLPALLYYFNAHSLIAAARRVLGATRVGQAIQSKFDALVALLRTKLGTLLEPIQARVDAILAPIRARVDAVLAPYTMRRDYLTAYFRRMARLLAVWISGPQPPPPGLEDDMMGILVVHGIPMVTLVWLPLGPLALSVLLTRKLIWGFGWALLSLQPKRSQATATPFRFIDLPAELRNRIYTYASDAALDIPMQIAYESTNHSKFDPERKKLHEIVVNLLNPFTISWDTTSAHRLALLFANRQVRQEFSALHFENMRLDFEFCDLRSYLPKMVQFIDTFGDRLRFVSKLEMPLGVAQTFLFDAASNEDLGCLDLSTETKAQLSAMRPSFSNVQQVIVYPDHKGITILEDAWDLANRQAVGFNILYHLAGLQSRDALNNTFPRLMDIVTRNKYGSERFGRLQDGSWRLWYLGVPIPTERAAWKDVMLAFPSVLFDPKTRLTGRLALNWVRA